MSITISNLTTEKAVTILEVLWLGVTYNTSEWDHVPSMRAMTRLPRIFDEEAAKAALVGLDKGENVYIDYFGNQCIKVNFTSTEIEIDGYDTNHGKGRAQKLIDFWFN